MNTNNPIVYNTLFNSKLGIVSLLLFSLFLSSIAQSSFSVSASGLFPFQSCEKTQVDIDHSQTNPLESKNLFNWEKEEKEEKPEADHHTDWVDGGYLNSSSKAFYKISVAEIQALKIPVETGKIPYYLLFHCLKIHLG